MNEFVQMLKANFPKMSEELAFNLTHLQFQFRNHFQGADETFSHQTFTEAWASDGQASSLPIEMKVACFMANPEWSGAGELEKMIRDILDSTMIEDEIDELRVLFLQNVFRQSKLDAVDIRFEIAQHPEWMWVLNPSWFEATPREDVPELLKLKYKFFNEMGWLTDASRENPVIDFQLKYLEQPEMSLQELLDMDAKLPQGSEIFLRLREVNPFQISFVYRCYVSDDAEKLKQFEVA